MTKLENEAKDTMRDDIKIYICGNAETLCSGYVRNSDKQVARDACLAARRVVRDSEHGEQVDVDDSRSFSDWNGGRHDQLHYRRGFVATNESDLEQWLVDLIDWMNEAMVDVLIAASKAQDEDDESIIRSIFFEVANELRDGGVNYEDNDLEQFVRDNWLDTYATRMADKFREQLTR